MQETFNHIGAKIGDIADIVFMCGDPNRATIMANKFLTNTSLVAELRGNKVYTGYYGDKRVTIMASFMGSPSMGIYSYELYNFYDVKYIFRLGTAGALREDIKIGSLFVADRSIVDSNYNMMHENGLDTTLLASSKLYDITLKTAEKMNIPLLTGDIYSTDTFYMSDALKNKIIATGAKCLEMESGALYANATLYKKDAITICTISDNIISGEKMSAEEREKETHEMFRLALETAKNL